MKKNKILITLFFTFLFMFSFVSSQELTFDYRMVKWTMCESFNLSGYNCDIFWETDNNPYFISYVGDDLDAYYNKSEIDNYYNNYYNKTDIDKMALNDFNISNLNGYYNKTDIDFIISTLKKDWLNNMSNDYVTKDELDNNNNNSNNNPSDNTIFIIIILAVVVVGGFFLINKNNQSRPVNSDYYGKSGQPVVSKMKSSEHLAMEKKIKELEEKQNKVSKEKEEFEEDGSN